MEIRNYHSIYFIGVGGIGMSALARWFLFNKFQVSGYDRTSTPLTDSLIGEGIDIHFEDRVELIPEDVKHSKDDVLVVFTPAIPEDHKEYNWLKDQGYEIMKRSQVLGLITKDMFTIAVAGTHGKTTTSSMIAHILKSSDRDCTAFLGGISTNYNSNLLINENFDEETIVVVEADEYDRSFLTLHPDVAVVTSMDADHLDIYGDPDHLKESFIEFINKTSFTGYIFLNDRIAGNFEEKRETGAKPFTYAVGGGDFAAEDLRVEGASYHFNVNTPEKNIEDLELYVPGFHNVENMTAAIGVALKVGVSESDIRSAVESYSGVKRRFEYIIREEEVVFIDDYAHHPVEIEAFLKSVRSLYPGKTITAIFQPHLYTRTRDFAEGFATSLSLSDELILLDIYPARELPLEGIDSQMLLDKVPMENKTLVGKKELISELSSRNVEVLCTIGAGDIDQLVPEIANHLKGGHHE